MISLSAPKTTDGVTPDGNISDRRVVYIIDDDALIRKALVRLLQPHPWTVAVYGSGTEFMADAHADMKGCVVMDVRLSESNGVEIVKMFRDRGYETPIIFITGYPDVQAGVTAMKLGAVDFLLKPIDEHDLLDALRRAMTVDEITRRAREERKAVQQRFETLTPRERQVLELVVTGLMNKHIALRLGTSEKTVKAQRGQVMEKMAAQSLAQLIYMAERIGVRKNSHPSLPPEKDL